VFNFSKKLNAKQALDYPTFTTKPRCFSLAATKPNFYHTKLRRRIARSSWKYEKEQLIQRKNTDISSQNKKGSLSVIRER